MRALPSTLSSSLRRHRFAPILLLGALTLGACGEGDDPAPGGTGSGNGGAAEVSIEDFTFVPETIEVAAGTTVRWINQDAAAHTVEDEGGLFPESQSLAQGESFSFTYQTPGEYPYICGIHPFMTATVTVT